MRQFVIAHVTLKATAEQHDGLSKAADRLEITWPAVLARVAQAAQDGAAREIARLTAKGPESTQGWQQRCNACREQRALECSECKPGEAVRDA